jgi:hypothetical protein
MQLEFRRIEGLYALARLPKGSEIPDLRRTRFAALVSSSRGITLVCAEEAAPRGAELETGYCCLEIVGSFALNSVGVVAAAIAPLALAGISVFVHSTWETDFVLLRADDLARAERALRDAGHKIVDSEAIIGSTPPMREK